MTSAPLPHNESNLIARSRTVPERRPSSRGEHARSWRVHTVTIECWCDIPNRPWPDAGTRGQLWWMPTEDAEPGPDVVSVMRVGNEPHLHRWERLPDGGWAQVEVDGRLLLRSCSPPAPWSRLGRCFAGTEHPVIAVWQRADGGRPVVDRGRARCCCPVTTKSTSPNIPTRCSRCCNPIPGVRPVCVLSVDGVGRAQPLTSAEVAHHLILAPKPAPSPPPEERAALAPPAPGRTQMIRTSVDGQPQWVVIAVSAVKG